MASMRTFSLVLYLMVITKAPLLLSVLYEIWNHVGSYSLHIYIYIYIYMCVCVCVCVCV
jgi:hypothetical protein